MGECELNLDSWAYHSKSHVTFTSMVRDEQGKNICSIQREGMAEAKATYYVAPLIHPLLGPRLSVLLCWAHTGTLCDTAELSVQ